MADFGLSLSRLRRERRLSQLELALRAGLSQRHISFIESGRAQPGPSAIRKLIDGLGLSRAEASALLNAAKLSGKTQGLDWFSPEFEQARAVASQLLGNHEPYPALICARDGTVLQSNAGFERLIAQADTDGRLAKLAGNLYDLTLHPGGLPQLMQNPELIIPHTLHRLKRAANDDDGAAKTLARIMRYATAKDSSFADLGTAAGSVLCEKYLLGDDLLHIITMTAAFGCPEEELAQQVSVELFFPADENAKAIMRELAA
jgi:transcriptional regulator with XRE-family HTH domain